ncbi:UNVERIFIED_CONTAM: Serine/threonine-protein kinase TOUSLED [Sesamum radiatum]|uniref:Serine/threonine-protein kinase TOUSLED n=1 Tax=Sesamum radiatum TaxID=300843 RepID=A0AAW2W4D0_SESRA
MSDDMILHFTSNSSNQSDQSSKIAKLEARLVGKASSAVASQPQVQTQLNSWSAPARFGGTQDSRPSLWSIVMILMMIYESLNSYANLIQGSVLSGGAFLIQANTQKRRKVEENSGTTVVEHVEGGNISGNVHQAASDARQKTIETIDSTKAGADVNKRKQGRGRANSASGRGRGHRVTDQARNQTFSPSNGQVENTNQKEEEAVMRERDRYELEKGRLIREMKRIRDEDGSRFNNFQILNHRYALLNLLGKGGFSEVYKAFDLVEHRYVACKLHGLNAQWSEDKKQSYIRHAIREYNIHKTLVHHHIVRLWDIFEIDQNTFCTVLEYCSGKDLDAVLKATPMLPEREARIIIVQIFQGLVYLNKRSQKIIHYDLKPGNVLFDDFGVAKVTDFGLSKIVEDDVGSQGMELTSQGAGTYWYLPPECFELNKTPLISSKVDVWSAGILLYQMLFGRRPFGHDQERILREDTIIKARKVEFPARYRMRQKNRIFCVKESMEDEKKWKLTVTRIVPRLLP